MKRYDRRVRGRLGHMWWGTAMESPDPAALAAFYSRLLDWPVVHQEPGTSVLKPPQESVFMVLQLAEDYVRPVWPPVTGHQRTMMHLDVQVDDLDAAVADAESLGAELAEIQPQANVRVMFDPDGHPFCLCREID
jgi:catechol 2,3-dioxygenase-like lactoylglutathione lyase family enzyme